MCWSEAAEPGYADVFPIKREEDVNEEQSEARRQMTGRTPMGRGSVDATRWRGGGQQRAVTGDQQATAMLNGNRTEATLASWCGESA